MTTERQIGESLIENFGIPKYEYRPNIWDRAALAQYFCRKFEALNRFVLPAADFDLLPEKTLIPDVFTAKPIDIRTGRPIIHRTSTLPAAVSYEFLQNQTA